MRFPSDIIEKSSVLDVSGFETDKILNWINKTLDYSLFTAEGPDFRVEIILALGNPCLGVGVMKENVLRGSDAYDFFNTLNIFEGKVYHLDFQDFLNIICGKPLFSELPSEYISFKEIFDECMSAGREIVIHFARRGYEKVLIIDSTGSSIQIPPEEGFLEANYLATLYESRYNKCLIGKTLK